MILTNQDGGPMGGGAGIVNPGGLLPESDTLHKAAGWAREARDEHGRWTSGGDQRAMHRHQGEAR